MYLILKENMYKGMQKLLCTILNNIISCNIILPIF